MSAVRSKLRDKSGVSVLMGLLFMLVCLMVGTVVLTASTAASGKLASLQESEQNYLTVASAARLLKKRIGVLKYERVDTSYTVDGAYAPAYPPSTVKTLTASAGSDVFWEEELLELCEILTPPPPPVPAPASIEKKLQISGTAPSGGPSEWETVYGTVKMEADGRIYVTLWLGDPASAEPEHNRMKLEFCPDGPIENTVVTSEELADGRIKEKTVVTKTCAWPEDGCIITKGTA